MLTITIQTTRAKNERLSAGVTTTTAIAIATQPSQRGRRPPRRIARPAAIPNTIMPAVLVATALLLSAFKPWAAEGSRCPEPWARAHPPQFEPEADPGERAWFALRKLRPTTFLLELHDTETVLGGVD